MRMFRITIIGVFLLFGLILLPTITAQDDAGILRVFVAGRELPPTAQAERRGQQTFIPVAAVARELGYLIEIDNKAESVRVQRAGVKAEFLKSNSEVRENGVTVAKVPNTSGVFFSPDENLLRLPGEVISTLLNVSVFIDSKGGIVRLEPRDGVKSAVVSQKRGFEINSLDYSYNASILDNYYTQYFYLNSTGNIGNNIFRARLNLLGGTNGAPFNFYGGNFSLLRPRGDRFQIGDLDILTGAELSLLNTQVRGASYTTPLLQQRAELSIYGGRSFSGFSDDFNQSIFSQNFDSNLFGARMSYRPFQPPANSPATPQVRLPRTRDITLFAGVTAFNSKESKGQMFDVGARYQTDKYNIEAELGFGNFNFRENISRNPNVPDRYAEGFGFGINLRASYSLWRNLTLQGRFDKYSPNFSTPQRSTQFNNREYKSVGFTARPTEWLSLGASASFDQGRNFFFLSDSAQTLTTTRNYSFNAALNPSNGYLPRLSLSATLIRNPLFGKLDLFRADVSREIKNVRPFVNYILVRTEGGGSSHNIGFGASVSTRKYGEFYGQQNFSLNKTMFLPVNPNCRSNILPQPIDVNCPLNERLGYGLTGSGGSLDWSAPGRLFNRFQLSFGAGYRSDREKTKFLFRSLLGAILPTGHTLQFGYSRNESGNEFRISLSGSLLFWKGKRDGLQNDQTSDAVIRRGAVNGRVYLDENFNHRFDEGIDVPLGGVRVQIDNGHVVTSDLKGEYKFASVEPGSHNLAINIEDVRANLVPAAGLEQNLVVSPFSVVETSFRLVKSGSVFGRVWNDKNGSKTYDEGEGMENVRIVSGSGRDTYTDFDGTYLLSDLPPGKQTIFIDARYLSPDVITANMSTLAEIQSGLTTQGINFIFTAKPREEKVVTFSPKPSTTPDE